MGKTIKNDFNADGTLTCRTCGVPKPRSEYYRNKANFTGYERVCKPCAQAKAKAWRQNNKQSRSVPDAEFGALRRARKRSAITDLEIGWREELLNFYDRKCLKCFSDGPLHADHVVPLSRGGSHTYDNLQVLCKTCNLKKHARTEDYRNGKILRNNKSSPE